MNELKLSPLPKGEDVFFRKQQVESGEKFSSKHSKILIW
jgi:hypothetical protein